MLPAKILNDIELTPNHIRALENSDRVTEFFHGLGYDVTGATDLTHESLGIDPAELRIQHIRKIAEGPDKQIQVYLFEVRSLAVALIQAIAQRLRHTGSDYLLVMTNDYEKLDFVLLEKTRTEGKGAGIGLKYVVRPRILTVSRRNPGSVALRVLKRFTFTEADEDFQWQKLRSAYTLAEWTEPDFNNRALFSDYYLKHRLTDKALNPAWAEDVRKVGGDAIRLISGARERLTGQNEGKTRADLIEPLFKLLGFAFTSDKAARADADYRLYAPTPHPKSLPHKEGGTSNPTTIASGTSNPKPLASTTPLPSTVPERGGTSNPTTIASTTPLPSLVGEGAGGWGDNLLALALVYKWNRNLDSTDPGRDDETPNENPGALVVTLLEKGEAPWVILTNGKLWRLYSTTASNKITNYYEIDLEEALFAPDRETGFKYWWLLFRREAFTGFLDKILTESQDYARQIGERLKDRIFKQIFGYFAGGFIQHMRDQGLDDSQIDLDLVFNATMTFLYRLMFVLYAESLELVPVKEEHGYGEHSLKLMKTEIARVAASLIDQANAKLKAHYDTESVSLYRRLQVLFGGIDKGEREINLPVYNGGLFSAEDATGAFLEQYAIPDVYLAIGLDRLARDVDDKTHALAFIDFKSLGVRLLEFKLRIAAEKLAVIRDGKREIYMPHAQAVKDKKTVVETVEPGQVYIENTKQERKATGSYYTPDYIVKYIVEHTVGPVLDEKLKALRPRLHEAQKRYRQNEARVKAATPHPKSLPHKEGGTSNAEQQWEISPQLERKMQEVARQFRKQPTPAEDRLWQSLRKEQLGVKFRRQMPIGPFIADFYCSPARLVVEVDGPIHDSQRPADQQRQTLIESLGIQVIRFTNDQVSNALPSVLETIRAVLAIPLPSSWGKGLGDGGGDPEVFWTQSEMQQLADDCLSVRVLDPAMGSGHFLVEVVDFVSNRLIDFLNGWSDNPVWALLERTRADILSEMEKQGVSIDEGKLTRVVLLKRSVLKRCVYGVDLNAMAVELAKVSLWLDAFTLGAPLSFLDHHLKWGNSLIGARIDEVRDYLETKADETVDMFAGNEFAGVMLATDLMRQVSYLSDNTVSQVRESRDSFHRADEHLRPFKRMLDVYVSRWFGNPPPTPNPSPLKREGNQATLSPSLPRGGRGRGMGGKTDSIKLFMKQPDVRTWLRNPSTRLDDSLIPATTIARTALHAAEEERFFHWELEFPEVFFAPSMPGGNDVQLRKGAGFDAVVGNPPYIRREESKADRHFYQELYSDVYDGGADLYVYFVRRAHSVLAQGGREGAIISNSFIRANYGTKLRGVLASTKKLVSVIDLSDTKVFTEVPDVYPAILICQNALPEPGSRFNAYVFGLEKPSELIPHIDSKLYPINQQDLAPSGWVLESLGILNLAKKIQSQSVSLGTYVTGRIFSGVKTSCNEAFVISRDEGSAIISDDPQSAQIIKPFLQGEELLRFEFSYTDRFIIIAYNGINIDMFPGAKRHLQKFKSALSERYEVKNGQHEWYELRPCDYYHVFESAKIMFPDISNQCKFTLDVAGHYVGNTGYVIPMEDYYLVALLNSAITWFAMGQISQPFGIRRGKFRYRFIYQNVDPLPIRRIVFTTSPNRRAELDEKGRKLYIRCLSEGHACVLEFTAHHLALNETDVIHDLLAFLAHQMIDLNKQKQTEVKHFLSWLEKTLQITPHPKSLPHKEGGTSKSKTLASGTPLPSLVGEGAGGWGAGIDSLPGKTIIQGYLGDYQKGEPEASFEDFYFRLHQNRNRFGIALASIRAQLEDEYHKSLDVLLPIKRQLATTDALIDKVVYQLYGLTEDEIKLIEYPQFEQAVTAAREEVLKDKDIKPGSDEAVEKIAEKVGQAAEQYFARVDETQIEAHLRAEIAGWDALPDKVRLFVKSGDLMLTQGTLPEYSGVVIQFAKAAETILNERLFLPFRAAGFTPNDCDNEFFQKFMAGGKPITLGSMGFILPSTDESTFRAFVIRHYPNASQTIFAKDKLLKLLDKAQVDARNGAAHDGVLTQDDAKAARQWAIEILGYV
ncbi:MAG: Eco57I restriction-modification methylase domain-containing protein [Aggregatilineales bacterium]